MKNVQCSSSGFVCFDQSDRMCTKDTGKTPFLSGCPSMWPICNRGEEGTCIDIYIHTYRCACVHMDFTDCIHSEAAEWLTEPLQPLGQCEADLS